MTCRPAATTRAAWPVKRGALSDIDALLSLPFPQTSNPTFTTDGRGRGGGTSRWACRPPMTLRPAPSPAAPRRSQPSLVASVVRPFLFVSLLPPSSLPLPLPPPQSPHDARHVNRQFINVRPKSRTRTPTATIADRNFEHDRFPLPPDSD